MKIKYAFFDKNGKQLTDFIFDNVEYGLTTRSHVKVQLEDKQFETNSFGDCISNCPSSDFLNRYNLKKTD